jgi:hypothetical protein
VAPNLPTELALEPEFDWVVGYELALKPKFCCPPLTPGGANVTSSFAPLMLRPMAVKGVLPGDAAIVLAFATAAAAMAAIGLPPGDEGILLAFVAIVAVALMLVGGGDGVCNIVASLGESWV